MSAKRLSWHLAVGAPALLFLTTSTNGWGTAQVTQQIPSQSQSGKVTVPGRIMAGNCSKMVTPIYAREVTSTATSATVVLEVVISRQGTVRPIRLVSGDASLRDAAMDAVRLWRFRPYLQNGEAVEVSTQLDVDFVPGRPGGLVTYPGPTAGG